MKDRTLTLLALLVACAALGHSAWLHSHGPAQADAALRRREAELVRTASPKVSQICQDLLGPSFPSATFQPATLEELVRPLAAIVLQKTASPGAERP